MILRGKHIVALVAVITVLMYMALAGLSAGCLFMHAASSAEQSHHEQDASHSPLCAWSCQATSQAALISQPPSASVGTPDIDVLVAGGAFTSAHQGERLQSRAPPLHLFS